MQVKSLGSPFHSVDDTSESDEREYRGMCIVDFLLPDLAG